MFSRNAERCAELPFLTEHLRGITSGLLLTVVILGYVLSLHRVPVQYRIPSLATNIFVSERGRNI